MVRHTQTIFRQSTSLPLIVCIGVSTLLKNTPPPSFLSSPPLNWQTVQALCFRQAPLYIRFSWTPPLKVGFSVKPQNNKSFSSITPSYIVKVTKLLVKISQFEFIDMTDKNIFAFKLFLSLSISDFNLFFMWKLHLLPLKKSPRLKAEVLSRHLFLNI